MDFSGLERDKLFLSSEGKQFFDVSYLGGVDNVQDGRGFAYSDLDHDGAEDLILINRNAPILTIYKNKLKRGNWIGLRLNGDGLRSNRDAAGSSVAARCGNSTVLRDVELGTGFGIQNSKTLTIGLGSCESVDELKIRWPSGKEQIFDHISVRQRYELTEGESLQTVPGYYKNAVQSIRAANSG